MQSLETGAGFEGSGAGAELGGDPGVLIGEDGFLSDEDCDIDPDSIDRFDDTLSQEIYKTNLILPLGCRLDGVQALIRQRR